MNKLLLEAGFKRLTNLGKRNPSSVLERYGKRKVDELPCNPDTGKFVRLTGRLCCNRFRELLAGQRRPVR